MWIAEPPSTSFHGRQQRGFHDAALHLPVNSRSRTAMTMRFRRATLVTLVATLTLTACSGSDVVVETESGPLGATLSAEGTAVTVTLTNTGDEEIKVVRPTVTPNFVVFIVTDSTGAELQYRGIYAELKPLGPAGFATLAPGETTSHEFDLTDLYGLGTGTYEVTAEYRNAALGSHEGTSALIFEPNEGIAAAPITIEVP